MKSTVITAVVGATAALLFTAASAQAGVISFADFDDLGSGTSATFFNVTNADGWLAGPNQIEIQRHDIAGNAFSQANLVELDTFANSSMFMNLGAGNYSLSYYYSPRPGIAASSNGITLSIGSTQLDSVTGAGAGDTVWQQRTVNFHTAGGALTFAAVGASDSLGGYLDNITLSTGVPEPATWALMIGGFGLAGASLRRRRASSAAA